MKVETKTCGICGVEKLLEEFARNSRRPDGRGSYCRVCAREKYHVPARERNRLVPQHFDGTQTCRVCAIDKPVAEYRWDRDKGRYRYDCNSCRRAQSREYNVQARDKRRDRNLRAKYGITAAEFDELLASQGGVCAICGTDPMTRTTKKAAAVDHDHATGAVRGVLCGQCNSAIGLLQEDPRILQAAIDYLNKFSTVRRR